MDPDEEIENESGLDEGPYDQEPPFEWQAMANVEYLEWLADHLSELGENYTDYLENR